MKLALECPTGLLEDIQPLADFDWILAHLVNTDKEYAEYYAQSEKFKVLDNSVNELLAPCTLDYLEKAAKIVNPNLIVAPDFLGDDLATLRALDEAITRFGGTNRVIPVVQGRDLEYVVHCFLSILDKGFDRVAIPYDVCCTRDADMNTMSRNRLRVATEIISKVPMGFKIHLLGFTTVEELKYHNRGWVESIDTGVPVMMGLKGKRLGIDTLKDKRKPTLERMTTSKVSPKKFSDINYNIAYLRRILNCGG